MLPIQKGQDSEWLTHPHTVTNTKERRGWLTYSFPHFCLYKSVKRVTEWLKTPTLLTIQKSQKGELITHSHTVACKKEPRGWMTCTLPHCCLYKRAKRVKDVLTPTLLPIQKSQEGEWLTHSHTVAYTKELRGWMTYSTQHCCLYKRAQRVNDLLASTLLPIK